MKKLFLVIFLIINTFFFHPSSIQEYPNDMIIVVEGGKFDYDDHKATGYTSILRNATETLANMWGWEFHYLCRTLDGLEDIRGDNVLLILDGHGGVYDGTQHLMINGTDIDVKEIAPKIHAKNLTVIVSSCYSKNYHYYFEPDNLNALYTSDRFNDTHTFGFSYTYDKETGEIIYLNIHSLITGMLDFLYEDYTYSDAYKYYWLPKDNYILAYGGTSYYFVP